MEAKTYLGLKQIGELFDVGAATVSKWRTRYAETDYPCPEPTVWIGDIPGWDDSSTWKAWKVTLPGQGAGGGPLPLGRARKELAEALATAEREHPGARNNDKRALLRVAALYGVDRRTAMAVWDRMAEADAHSPNDELDVHAIAHIIRGRKRLDLTAGSSDEPQQ